MSKLEWLEKVNFSKTLGFGHKMIIVNSLCIRFQFCENLSSLQSITLYRYKNMFSYFWNIRDPKQKSKHIFGDFCDPHEHKKTKMLTSKLCVPIFFFLFLNWIRFTCGPRVSKTGAVGAYTNMINMTNKHDRSNAATTNDNAHSSNKSDKVIEEETEI